MFRAFVAVSGAGLPLLFILLAMFLLVGTAAVAAAGAAAVAAAVAGRFVSLSLIALLLFLIFLMFLSRYTNFRFEEFIPHLSFNVGRLHRLDVKLVSGSKFWILFNVTACVQNPFAIEASLN